MLNVPYNYLNSIATLVDCLVKSKIKSILRVMPKRKLKIDTNFK